MKQAWRNGLARIDALSLRERCLVFAVAAALLALVLQTMLLTPLFERQKKLSQRIVEQRNKIASVDADIVRRLADHQNDPDLAARIRLQALQQQVLQLGSAIRSVETGLVPPDKMAIVLETMLKSHGRLRLLSLKTIGVSSASNASVASVVRPGQPAKPAQPAQPAQPAPLPSANLIYRHGVTIAVRGQYQDLLAYLQALEAMPTHLFWGDARLNVDGYPNSVLTLSLYTLSLDQQWMQL